MFKLIKHSIINTMVGSLVLLTSIGYAQTYTPEEAEQIYRNNGCHMVSQTTDSICFNCDVTPTDYPECTHPLNIEVTVHWNPLWELPPGSCIPDGSCNAPEPECATVTTGTDNCGNTCTKSGGICPPPVCVPDGSCSAPTPACNTTTTGVDNCNQSCSKVGEPCPCVPDGSCSALVPACEEVTTGTDNCGNLCTKEGEPCPVEPPPDIAGVIIGALSGNNSGFIELNTGLTTEDLGANLGDTSGPRASYIVNIPRTGTWYVWIRGNGPSGSSDSFHYGLDGTLVNSITLASYLSWNRLPWARALQNETGVATMQITTLGTHTIDIWQREDGTFFDAIMITDNQNYTP